jgi:hypothetical protein
MPEESRIIDFPEATAPAADDYLLMDSEANGTQKILVSKIGGGGGGIIVTKTITANGTYSASSDNADGYDPVIVNVASEPVINPVYNWFTNEDGTLVVREKISDGSFRWYFNNYIITSDMYMPVPQNLARFYMENVGCASWWDNWYDPTEHPERQPNGVIGFYGNTIRGWSSGLMYNMKGTCNNAVIESTDVGIAYENYHGYIEPSFDPING